MHLDGLVKMKIRVFNGYIHFGDVNIHADDEYAFEWSCADEVH